MTREVYILVSPQEGQRKDDTFKWSGVGPLQVFCIGNSQILSPGQYEYQGVIEKAYHWI